MNQIPNIEEWEKEFDEQFKGAIQLKRKPDSVTVTRLKHFIHQQLQKARAEQNKHIGNQLLAYYENNVDPKGELKDKWFVKLVKNLADILVEPKDHSELDQDKK